MLPAPQRRLPGGRQLLCGSDHVGTVTATCVDSGTRQPRPQTAWGHHLRVSKPGWRRCGDLPRAAAGPGGQKPEGPGNAIADPRLRAHQDPHPTPEPPHLENWVSSNPVFAVAQGVLQGLAEKDFNPLWALTRALPVPSGPHFSPMRRSAGQQQRQSARIRAGGPAPALLVCVWLGPQLTR